MTIESTFQQAENTADNATSYAGYSQRYDCLIRTAKHLRLKIMERVS